MQNPPPPTKNKKVLFLITKSNWGEKVYRHFRKTLPSIFVENTDKVYRVCKTALSRPTDIINYFNENSKQKESPFSDN